MIEQSIAVEFFLLAIENPSWDANSCHQAVSALNIFPSDLVGHVTQVVLTIFNRIKPAKLQTISLAVSVFLRQKAIDRCGEFSGPGDCEAAIKTLSFSSFPEDQARQRTNEQIKFIDDLFAFVSSLVGLAFAFPKENIDQLLSRRIFENGQFSPFVESFQECLDAIPPAQRQGILPAEVIELVRIELGHALRGKRATLQRRLAIIETQ